MIEPFFSYLDPGTGATLAQLALAGTAGLAAFGKLRMNRIKARLGRKQEEDDQVPPDPPADASESSE